MKSFPLFYLAGLLALSFHGFIAADHARGQVVQLPSAGTFNLSTSVAVPDSGSASLGSSGFGRSGSAGRGPLGLGSSYGSNLGGSGVSVRATVIDLAELDSMIRSQSGKNPTSPMLHSADPREPIHVRTAPRRRNDSPEYDYLAALSRNGNVVDSFDPDAVKFYLGMAEQARSRGTWSSVELYYTLAWKNLPPSRREAALQELAKARALGKKAEAEAEAKNQKKAK